jgi:uncharacterized membrane protein YoaK (UPF0700 family)
MSRIDDTHLRDVLLVALTLSMGSIDAISWLGLGKVYSAFQSGNIVVVGFGLADAPGPPALQAGVSLAAFGLGALISGELVAREVVGAMWPRRVSVVLGTVLTAQAAFLAVWLLVHAHPGDGSADILIAIAALAAGLQTGAIFSLGVRAVFTTAATATWTAIMSNLARGSRSRADLWRLTSVVIGAFAGAVAGGALMVHASPRSCLAPALTLGVLMTAELALGRRTQAPRSSDVPAPTVTAS